VSDVQLENGYTMIANEILDNIAKLKLSPTQHSLVYVIWRYTYGFKRKKHKMSLSFLAKATNCDSRNIQRELRRLDERNIIKQSIIKNNRFIGFNKNYHEWNNGETDNGETDNGETDNCRDRQFNIGETDKETIGETANQERKKEKLKENSANNLIDDFFEQLWKLYPNKKGKSTVSKKSKKAIYEIGIEKMTKAIDNYKKDLQANTWKQAMNGSTFFNGRYEDYFETVQQEEPDMISIYPDL